MSVWLIKYDDVAATYGTAGPEIYHDAWYIRGREITEDVPDDQDVLVWDAATGKFVFKPGGSLYNGWFPMGW